MPWESDEGAESTGRDWARYLWAGVLLLIVAGVVLVFLPRGRDASITEARVKQILVMLDSNDEAGAQAAYDEIHRLRQRVLDGESFSKLAQEYSDDRWSGERGGDLGWVKRGELTEALDPYVWSTPVGQVSNVIVTGQGLHLILVTERHFSPAEQYEQELKQRVLEDAGKAATSNP